MSSQWNSNNMTKHYCQNEYSKIMSSQVMIYSIYLLYIILFSIRLTFRVPDVMVHAFLLLRLLVVY